MHYFTSLFCLLLANNNVLSFTFPSNQDGHVRNIHRILDPSSTLSNQVDEIGVEATEFLGQDLLLESHHNTTSPAANGTAVKPPTCVLPFGVYDQSSCEEEEEYPAEHILRAVLKNKAIVETIIVPKPADIEEDSLEESASVEDYYDAIIIDSGVQARSSFSGATNFVAPNKNEADKPVQISTNMCKTIRNHVTPRSAVNKGGKKRWIVNIAKEEGGADTEEDYIQLVTVTTCADAGSQCAAIGLHRTECKQEYVEHKLLAFDENREMLVVDTFPFPSCCTCNIITSLEV